MWNEVEALPILLPKIKRTMLGLSYELIIVDDGSTDGSTKYATLKLSHRGKWNALREGLKIARGSIIITCDGDGQDDPHEVRKLLKYLDSGLDIVSGQRQNRQDDFLYVLLSRIGNRLLGFSDMNSQMKVYKVGVLRDLSKLLDSWRFILLLAKIKKYKVLEVPVKHYRRKFGKSKFGLVKYFSIGYDLIRVYITCGYQYLHRF